MTYGSTPYLYSDMRQGTANVHFRWMQENQIDGVLLQRFILECPGDPDDTIQHIRDFRLFIGTGVTRTLDWIQTATVSSLKPWTVGCDLGNPDINNGLALRPNGDGDTTTATIGGRSCKRNLDSGNDYYMYFQASNLFCLEGSHPDMYVRFDYYDTGTGTIRLEYDGASGAYQNGPTVTLANSNTWKQANMHITDAYFANRQNNSSDFRLYLGTGVTRYIDAVTLRVGP